jgi:signal transduction histidine kinase
LGIDATAAELPAGSPAADQLERARHAVSSAIDDLRQIIAGLRPPALDELGLAGALRDRFTTLRGASGCEILLQAHRLPALPPAVEVAAYHIAAEAVHNALGHAEATQVDVSLTHHAGTLRLRVGDDGRWAHPADGSGNGLFTMRQRAEEIGGRLAVASGPRGTTIDAELPTGPLP